MLHEPLPVWSSLIFQDSHENCLAVPVWYFSYPTVSISALVVWFRGAGKSVKRVHWSKNEALVNLVWHGWVERVPSCSVNYHSAFCLRWESLSLKFSLEEFGVNSQIQGHNELWREFGRRELEGEKRQLVVLYQVAPTRFKYVSMRHGWDLTLWLIDSQADDGILSIFSSQRRMFELCDIIWVQWNALRAALKAIIVPSFQTAFD